MLPHANAIHQPFRSVTDVLFMSKASAIMQHCWIYLYQENAIFYSAMGSSPPRNRRLARLLVMEKFLASLGMDGGQAAATAGIYADSDLEPTVSSICICSTECFSLWAGVLFLPKPVLKKDRVKRAVEAVQVKNVKAAKTASARAAEQTAPRQKRREDIKTERAIKPEK